MTSLSHGQQPKLGIMAIIQPRTTSHSLNRIQITWRIIKTKTSSSFHEGVFVIEGQSH
jgi:hypothetical protein